MTKSKKHTLAIVSALGVLMIIITALVSAARKQGGTDADIYYKVFVDYGQTLQQMIDDGKYDYANSDINASNFPFDSAQGRQNVVIELVHFERGMESKAVLKEFKARGLRVATLPELLAFGSRNREKQREFPIVALGSVWQDRRGDHYVPVLRFGSRRRLYLLWYDYGWDVDCRFAAVRK